MTDIPEEQLVKKGKMIKAPGTMTPAERDEWEWKMQPEAEGIPFFDCSTSCLLKTGSYDC